MLRHIILDGRVFEYSYAVQAKEERAWVSDLWLPAEDTLIRECVNGTGEVDPVVY
jgi:hypothetical protein